MSVSPSPLLNSIPSVLPHSHRQAETTAGASHQPLWLLAFPLPSQSVLFLRATVLKSEFNHDNRQLPPKSKLLLTASETLLDLLPGNPWHHRRRVPTKLTIIPCTHQAAHASMLLHLLFPLPVIHLAPSLTPPQ